MTRVKSWVKISKVMPQPKSIPPGKGGKGGKGGNPNLSATNVIWLNRTHSYNPNLSATNVIQLNRTHSFKFTTKFFISVLYFGKIQAN